MENGVKLKTLVLGLGNSILSDDGVGLRVVQLLGSVIRDSSEVTISEATVSGLDLLDYLVDYDRAIIIDAIQTENGKPGQVYRLEDSEFKPARHLSNTHSINFATALELGRQTGLRLPGKIVTFGVEVQDVTTISEKCTPLIEEQIPLLVEQVLQELKETTSACRA